MRNSVRIRRRAAQNAAFGAATVRAVPATVRAVPATARILALVVATTLALTASAQSVLRGRVTSDAGKPLAGASIFISNTSKGTITDEKGDFTLSGVPAGRYVLVVSSVGYQNDLETIDSRFPRNDFEIVLRTKAKELGEVRVRAFDADGYKRWGELFKENFIGTSDFARNCQILNPESVKIHFARKSRVLEAYSDGPILVQNRSLGYQVQVTLDDFRYDFANQSVAFSFFPLFTEMQGSPSKKARWERNRATAYYGSALHFFRALYQDRVEQEGFMLHTEGRKDSLAMMRVKSWLRQSLARARDSAGQDGARLMPEALLDRGMLAQCDNTLDLIRQQPLLMYPQETHAEQAIVVARDSNDVVLDWDLSLRVLYLKARTPDRYLSDFIIDPNNPESGRKVQVSRSSLTGMATDLELLRGFPMEVFPNGSYMNTDLVFQGYWTWSQKIGNLLPYDYEPPKAAVPPGPPYQ